MEVAQEHRGEALEIADAGAVVVPRRARGLVGLVEIARAELVLQPQQRDGIAGNVAALAAALVVPELRRRDALGPAVERLDVDRLVLVGDAVDDDLAVLFELPHDIAHVLDAILVGQHRAAVDALLDPGGGGRGFAGGEVRGLPFGAVAGEALAGLRRAVGRIAHFLLLRREDFAGDFSRFLRAGRVQRGGCAIIASSRFCIFFGETSSMRVWIIQT